MQEALEWQRLCGTEEREAGGWGDGRLHLVVHWQFLEELPWKIKDSVLHDYMCFTSLNIFRSPPHLERPRQAFAFFGRPGPPPRACGLERRCVRGSNRAGDALRWFVFCFPL